MAIIDDFELAMERISDKVVGDKSIYSKTLTTLNSLYTEFGYSENTKSKMIAEISGQLAISTTNASLTAAISLAKETSLYDLRKNESDAKVRGTDASNIQIQRQTTSFDDKLAVEEMNAWKDIASMEATNTGVSEGVKISLNNSIIKIRERIENVTYYKDINGNFKALYDGSYAIAGDKYNLVDEHYEVADDGIYVIDIYGDYNIFGTLKYGLVDGKYVVGADDIHGYYLLGEDGTYTLHTYTHI